MHRCVILTGALSSLMMYHYHLPANVRYVLFHQEMPVSAPILVLVPQTMGRMTLWLPMIHFKKNPLLCQQKGRILIGTPRAHFLQAPIQLQEGDSGTQASPISENEVISQFIANVLEPEEVMTLLSLDKKEDQS